MKSASSTPGSPIVFLAGGPGVPATGIGRVPVYFELFRKLLGIADVILLDQRGVGTSLPDTQCPPRPPLPADVFLSDARFLGALAAQARNCAGYWRGKNVHAASFNTAASADDLEDLRVALRADRLSLVAHSYGTAVALAAMRRHGEHLDRVVLAGVVGPDRNFHLPLDVDFALRRISGLATASAASNKTFQDTYGTFARILADLDRRPLSVVVHSRQTNQEVRLQVGRFGFQFAVAQMLANGRKVASIPSLIASTHSGDLTLLTRTIQDLYNNFASGFSLMQFGTWCSDGYSPERWRRATEQASQSVFGDATFLQFDPRLCSQVDHAAIDLRSLVSLWSSVPTLLVSGSLDSNTPPFDADEVAWGLPNATSLRVGNGFHETLPIGEVQDLVAEFLRRGTIDQRYVEVAPPEFLTIEQAEKAPGIEH